jgi:hypothetical protein
MSLPRRTSAFAHLAVVLLVSAVLAYGLRANAAIAAQLTASWIDNSGGLASFELQRRTKGDLTYRTIADLAPRVTRYTDRAIVEGVLYCYRVRSYNDFGDSPFSPEACGAATVSEYTVSVRKAGTGTGLVANTTGDIFCGKDCGSTFASGEPVTLIADPDQGSRFVGWSGGCSGTGLCVVTGNAPIAITATFERRT